MNGFLIIQVAAQLRLLMSLEMNVAHVRSHKTEATDGFISKKKMWSDAMFICGDEKIFILKESS